jgi:hypothetical protein
LGQSGRAASRHGREAARQGGSKKQLRTARHACACMVCRVWSQRSIMAAQCTFLALVEVRSVTDDVGAGRVDKAEHLRLEPLAFAVPVHLNELPDKRLQVWKWRGVKWHGVKEERRVPKE